MIFDYMADAKENEKRFKINELKKMFKRLNGTVDIDHLSIGDDILYKIAKPHYSEAVREYIQEQSMRLSRAKVSLSETGEALAGKAKEVWDDVGNKALEFVGTSDIIKGGALLCQGVAKSPFNPAGVLYRQTNPEWIEPEGVLEQAIEGIAEGLYSAYAGGALARTKTVTKAAMSSNKIKRRLAKGFQYVALPGAEGAYVGGAVGAKVLPEVVDLKKPADDAPMSEKVKYFAATGGVEMLGGALGGGLGMAAQKALNNRVVEKGTKALIHQFMSQEFNDIDYGRFERRMLAALNKIRLENGEALMKDNKLMIPKNVVKHIYERRVEGNGMSPERVARMLKEAFHGKGNIVGQGNASHIQEIRKPGNVKSKAGYIAINPKNGKNVVKTSYPKDNK